MAFREISDFDGSFMLVWVFHHSSSSGRQRLPAIILSWRWMSRSVFYHEITRPKLSIVFGQEWTIRFNISAYIHLSIFLLLPNLKGLGLSFTMKWFSCCKDSVRTRKRFYTFTTVRVLGAFVILSFAGNLPISILFCPHQRLAQRQWFCGNSPSGFEKCFQWLSTTQSRRNRTAYTEAIYVKIFMRLFLIPRTHGIKFSRWIFAIANQTEPEI